MQPTHLPDDPYLINLAASEGTQMPGSDRRRVRRAVHPVRTVKRAASPKVVKKATRAMHPVG